MAEYRYLSFIEVVKRITCAELSDPDKPRKILLEDGVLQNRRADVSD